MHPLRIGLAGVVDYAGLFPPASLDLPAVVSNVERYVQGELGWMIGRLVVPLRQLEACAELVRQVAPAGAVQRWTVSVLVQAGDALSDVEPAVHAFNARVAEHGVAVVAVETAAANPAEVEAAANGIPDTLERYVEVAIGPTLDAVLDCVAITGCYAKVRTGGLSADCIPSTDALARFVAACWAREVPFKATAGLHHPVRAAYPLTYEAGSARATMHGFVNLVAASALLYARVLEPSRVAAVLDETDAATFVPEPGRLRWRDTAADIAELAESRSHLLRSVGSCSFEEPVEELRRLGWLREAGG